MKSSVKTMFAVLAVLMSFAIVQAQGFVCTEVVDGLVTEITDTGEITVTVDDVGEITVYGVPADWEIVEVDDNVVINAHETNNDKLIACYLTVNGGDVIELRPRVSEQSVVESVTVAADTECTCDCDCVGDANRYKGNK